MLSRHVRTECGAESYKSPADKIGTATFLFNSTWKSFELNLEKLLTKSQPIPVISENSGYEQLEAVVFQNLR